MGWLFWTAVVLLVLTRLFLLLAFRPDSSDARGLYFEFAAKGVDLGQTPYKDFMVEYPPVAWWAVAAPRWIDPVKLSPKAPRHEAQRARGRYHRLFRWEMFLCDAASFVLLTAIIRRRRPDLTGIVALSYVVTTTLLAHLLYDRLDAGLLLLILCWGYCWLRSIEPPGQAGWLAGAYLMLGLSISFKVVPVIVVPFLLLATLHTTTRWRDLAIGIGMLLLGITGPFAIYWPTAGGDTLKFLTFHSNRGLQLESLASSLLIVASWFGLKVEAVHPYGGFDLASSWSAIAKTISNIALFGFLAIAGLKALIEWRNYTPERAYRYALWVIATAVILATVLSPQYFVWALPVILMLAVELLPEGKGGAVVVAISLIVIALLSTWIFPYHYFEDDLRSSLVELDRPACIVLVVRNLLYFCIVAGLGVLLLVRKSPTTVAIPAA